jgi:hypothetical protein
MGGTAGPAVADPTVFVPCGTGRGSRFLADFSTRVESGVEGIEDWQEENRGSSRCQLRVGIRCR